MSVTYLPVRRREMNVLLEAARAYAEDLSTGLEDGTYDDDDGKQASRLKELQAVIEQLSGA